MKDNLINFEVLGCCEIPIEPPLQISGEGRTEQQMNHNVGMMPTMLEIPLKIVRKSGKRLIKDPSGDNCLQLSEWDNKGQVWTEFLRPVVGNIVRIDVRTKNGIEVLYQLFKGSFFVSAESESFFITLEDMKKWSHICSILAQNGVEVTCTKRESRQLFETFVNSAIVSRVEYPYKPGWNGGVFQYNENGEIEIPQNTPFLSKRLITSGKLSEKKSFDIIFEQLKLVDEERIRMLIFLLMHLTLLGEVIEIEAIKQTLFGIYGDIKVGSQLALLFFQFYDRDSKEICFLYDTDAVEKAEMCKDEVLFVVDRFPETSYKRMCAEKNFSDIKDIAEKRKSDGIYLFISDCGMVTDDDEIFHLTSSQKYIEEVPGIKEAVGTHIKFFTKWIEKNLSFKDNCQEFCVESQQKKFCNIFHAAYLILDGMCSVDIGNIMDRSDSEYYISEVFDAEDKKAVKVSWEATNGKKTWVKIQFRCAEVKEDLDNTPWSESFENGADISSLCLTHFVQYKPCHL